MGRVRRSTLPLLLLLLLAHDLVPRGMALSSFTVTERLFRSTDGSPDVTIKVLGNSRTGEWVTNAHTHARAHTEQHLPVSLISS